MKEIWKDISEYEGRYQVSNLGNIKNIKTGRILKPRLTHTGYYQVHFTLNGKEKNYKVHRLVAKEFINNPNNYKEVNHKDENRLNNAAFNLEWCNRDYNVNYGSRTKKTFKKVAQYSIDGNLVKVWDSINDAVKKGLFHSGCIIDCCKGKRKLHKGYMWRYI